MDYNLSKSFKDLKQSGISEDFLTVNIPSIQSSFRPESGGWDIERGELKARENQLHQLYQKEQFRQLLLMHLLAVKDVDLLKYRKKIASLLSENSGILEMQGFSVGELLESPDLQKILCEDS